MCCAPQYFVQPNVWRFLTTEPINVILLILYLFAVYLVLTVFSFYTHYYFCIMLFLYCNYLFCIKTGCFCIKINNDFYIFRIRKKKLINIKKDTRSCLERVCIMKWFLKFRIIIKNGMTVVNLYRDCSLTLH